MSRNYFAIFSILMILFSMFPVQAVPPTQYYEIDSDVELSGAIFVDVDPSSFYGSLIDGVIQIDSSTHFDNVSVRFKGTALGSRLKKYNGFNVSYTHIADDGVVMHELKPLEIDYQGFAYLTTDFSTVIINGMTGTTTQIYTSQNGNQSFSVPDGSSYDINITNNQEGIWNVNEYNWTYKSLFYMNATASFSNSQFELNETNFPLNATEFGYIETDGNGLPIMNITYSNNTIIPFWVEYWDNVSSYKFWVKTSAGIENKTLNYYCNGNSGVSSSSNGDDTFIQWHGSASSQYVDTLTSDLVGPIIVEGKVRATASSHNLNWGIADAAANFGGDRFTIKSYSAGADIYGYSENDGSSTIVGRFDEGGFVLNQWYNIKITYDDTTARFYFDGTELEDGNTLNIPDENMGLQYYAQTGTGEQEFLFARKYAIEPTWALGAPQIAQGAINITASVTGNSNEQLYNTSQSREFTLTPTSTNDYVNITTTSTDYDITITTYWTDDTTQYSQTSASGYVKSFINCTASDDITIAIFNDTINLGTHDFSSDGYIGTITATINGSSISASRTGQEINATAYNLSAGIEYRINFSIPVNNKPTVGTISNIDTFLGFNHSFTAPSFSDPEGLGKHNESWNFGDGYSSNVTDPYHTYTSIGSFSANYSVTENATISPWTELKEFIVNVVVKPPYDLQANTSLTSVNLTWDAHSSADNFTVYQNDGFLTNTSLKNYNITGLTSATEYTFAITAWNGSSESSKTSIIVSTTGATSNTTAASSSLLSGSVASGLLSGNETLVIGDSNSKYVLNIGSLYSLIFDKTSADNLSGQIMEWLKVTTGKTLDWLRSTFGTITVQSPGTPQERSTFWTIVLIFSIILFISGVTDKNPKVKPVPAAAFGFILSTISVFYLGLFSIVI